MDGTATSGSDDTTTSVAAAGGSAESAAAAAAAAAVAAVPPRQETGPAGGDDDTSTAVECTVVTVAAESGAALLPIRRPGTKYRPKTGTAFATIMQLQEPTEDGFTHQCQLCGEKVKCRKNSKGSFKNDNAKSHLKSKHADFLGTQLQEQSRRQRDRNSQMKRQRMLLESFTSCPSKSHQALINAAKVAQFRFYVYGKQRTSKQTLEDDYFRACITAAYVAGGGKAADTPLIGKRELVLVLPAAAADC